MTTFVMFVKRVSTFSLFLLVLLTCRQEQPRKDKINNHTIIDDMGEVIDVTRPVRRIISLYSAHTENCFELGLANEIIGVYVTDHFPAEAADKKKFDYRNDAETIIAQNPDCVLVRPFINKGYPRLVEHLKRAGIKVVSLYPARFDEFDSYILKLGRLTGREKKAQKKLEQFHAQLKKIENSARQQPNRVRVFFESSGSQLKTVTADSLPGLAIELSGGVNVASGVKPIRNGSSIAHYDREKLLLQGSNLDIYVAQSGRMNPGISVEAIIKRPGYPVLKAVREGKVLVIDEALISRPTFRYVEGVQMLYDFFYPGHLN